MRQPRDRASATALRLDARRYSEWKRRAVKVSLANLRTFPLVADREKRGELVVHGAPLLHRGGELYVLDEAEDNFRPA